MYLVMSWRSLLPRCVKCVCNCNGPLTLSIDTKIPVECQEQLFRPCHSLLRQLIDHLLSMGWGRKHTYILGWKEKSVALEFKDDGRVIPINKSRWF